MKTHDTDNLVNNDFGTVMTAQYQLENRDRWRENARKTRWSHIKGRLIAKIHRLWETDGSYVNFWEEDWFPDTEEFLDELQGLGYHVYSDLGRPNNSGPTQKRYIITLDPKDDYYPERKKGIGK